MPACFIAEIEIKKPEMYAQYIETAFPIVESYGGRYIFCSKSIHPISGNWSSGRMIMIEFGNKEEVFECFSSDRYISVAPFREGSTQSMSIIVEC